MLGAGYYLTEGRATVAQSTGFFTDSFETDNLQSGSNQDERYTGSSHAKTTKLSQFGRVSYTYKDKYTLLATLRRDGSSYFAKNHKWGIFPSISGAWRLSEESWAKLVLRVTNPKTQILSQFMQPKNLPVLVLKFRMG